MCLTVYGMKATVIFAVLPDTSFPFQHRSGDEPRDEPGASEKMNRVKTDRRVLVRFLLLIRGFCYCYKNSD